MGGASGLFANVCPGTEKSPVFGDESRPMGDGPNGGPVWRDRGGAGFFEDQGNDRQATSGASEATDSGFCMHPVGGIWQKDVGTVSGAIRESGVLFCRAFRGQLLPIGLYGLGR